MPQQKSTKHRTSIRKRLIKSNSVVIILTVILIEALLTLILVRSLVQDSQASNSELVKTMSNSFDDTYLSFKWTIDSITMDDTFQSVLSGRSGVTYENGEDNAILSSIISDASLLCEEMEKVCLYDANGNQKVILNRIRSSTQDVSYPTLDADWFDESGRVSSHVLDGKLVFTRIIYDKSNWEKLGYILCVYQQSGLAKRINTVVPTSNRFVVVLDSSGQTVVHNYPDELLVNDIVGYITQSQPHYIQNVLRLPGIGPVLAAQHYSSRTGWRTVSMISLYDVLYTYIDSFLAIALLGIFSMLLCFFVQRSLARRIVKPLEEITRSVMQAKSGDYSIRVQTDTNDEIATLAEAYNHLLEKTDVLVNQILKSKLAYQEAQLEALQSQINPHLLFNTFECLNWLAAYGRQDDIRRVTAALSKLMKAMLSNQRMITLSEELELTRNFLLIYEILLEGKMTASIECHTSAIQMEIPKLTIQPLVENAVIHGIKPNGGGCVSVVVTDDSGGTTIYITDDGVGMKQEQVTAINEYASGSVSSTPTGMHVGMKNVIDRLRLIYGTDTTLQISSTRELGTFVCLTIPHSAETKQ